MNIFIILGMGAAVGFLSGMFGVGGGFLITPLLIFYNIPPVVAVATGANQVVASSISGAITHFRRGTLDMKLRFGTADRWSLRRPASASGSSRC